MTDFVSLHNQTDFSILDSLASPKALLARAKELGQPAIAITDHGTLASTWDAWKASKELGIKLIIGCECYFQNDASNIEEKFRHIVLIATNAIGYRNLLTLNKKGFDQSSFVGKRVYSVLDWKLLEQYSEGLICLTACGNGIVSQLLMNGKFDEAERTLLKLRDIFEDRLGIEIQPNNMKRGSNIFNDEIDQQFLNKRLIDLGKKHDIKIVPACNTHYINKEDHDVHDVFLCIGSHQPKYSNFRLKYSVPEFYLKSGEEVKVFFTRNYGEEFAKEICNNTIYFANMCEVPEWIDPKYSNPSGKELPIFPVKDEPNYNQFVSWTNNLPENLKTIDEDKLYLRYLCQIKFDSRVKNLTDQQKKNYLDRIDEELDVLEFHGFSSYMLIVADYIEWARANGIAVGEGRGCLTGDTQVLTSNGFKLLKNITEGMQVYTDSGNLKTVSNTFKFDVSKETLLKFRSHQSFNDLIMTKDHKVLVAKPDLISKTYKYNGKNFNRKIKNFNPELNWEEAHNVKVGDYLFTPTLSRKILDLKPFDLAKYGFYDNDDNYLINKIYYKTELSIKNISKKSKLSFETIRRFKNTKQISSSNYQQLEKYLSKINCSVDEFLSHKNYKDSKINRYLEVNEKLTYVLGRWIGDGAFNGKSGICICFNAKDKKGINTCKKYFTSLGFHVTHENRSNNNVLLTVTNKAIYALFKEMFPDYNSSYNKYIPNMFRNFNQSLIKSLLLGIIDSDGCIINNSEKVKTTSKRLALEIKEALNYLSIPSSIYTEKQPKRYDVVTAPAYTVMFNGINTPFNKNNIITDKGFYSKITKISKVKRKYVYDITVKDNHNYLTSSGIVHNSVGGSLIAYLLGIHQADPIKYDLIFARFHNKEKSSFPDIDSDFAPSGREKVQNYLRQKYGEDHVAHVSNVNTITPKVYVRDIARSCELGGSREEAIKIGNDVADCIPADIKSIDDALEKIPLFAEYCKKYPEFIKYKEICGKYRAWSTHAGGIIISSRPLTGLVPLRKDKDGALAVEYDKEKAEENGLVKMDTLGLSTLDIIGQTIELIKESGKDVPSEIDYDFYDAKAYDLLSKGNTFGVFQLGTSGGTIDLCRRIKPQSINDISYVNSLARPSARDMRNDFIATKDGKKQFTLLHANLGRAFNETYGFGLYEESLMYLAQDIAGWSLHSADRLRKLTKEKGKNPKKAQQWKTEFIDDAVKNNVNEEIAKRIWSEVIEPFSGYGFNKSHSVLYSMTSYKTAYLKAHYTIEFLLANLMAEVKSNAPDANRNIEKIKKELRSSKVKILPPDINKSKLSYAIQNENQLITGLDAIKFVGDEAIKDIIEKRPFKNIFDFMSRVDSKKVRANNIQALAACGALDSFNLTRKLMFLYISDYRKKLQVWLKKHDPSKEEFVYPWSNEGEWSIAERYALEQHYMGEAFICKPAVAYDNFFKDEHFTIGQIKKMKEKTIVKSIKGIVKTFFEFKVKKETSKYYGQSMIKAIIEDKNGEYCSCTIFPDRWKEVQERIKQIHSKTIFDSGLALHFSGNVNLYEDEVGIIFDKLFDIKRMPSVPDDLKAKKVALKATKSKDNKTNKNNNFENLLEQIEDNLYDEGLIDLDSELESD